MSALSIALSWIHLLATVAWIGGLFANILVYLPAIRKTLDPPSAGKLMGAVMGRFRTLVYTSMILLLVTGTGSAWSRINDGSTSEMNDAWIVLVILKAGLFLLMILLTLYAFEFLAPKAARLAGEGPSPALMKVQRNQMRLAFTGLILGLIILALSAAL